MRDEGEVVVLRSFSIGNLLVDAHKPWQLLNRDIISSQMMPWGLPASQAELNGVRPQKDIGEGRNLKMKQNFLLCLFPLHSIPDSKSVACFSNQNTS